MNKRIIVIDDEEAILNDYRMILSPAKDPLTLLLEEELAISGPMPMKTTAGTSGEVYEPYLTTSGEDGFTKINESMQKGTPYAVAFIDMKMPLGWDGLHTSKMIRNVDKHIEIVIVTAYSETRRGKIVDAVGMPERLLYIKKPFDSEEIKQLALNLTRKWDIETKLERHMYFMEVLLESVRRLKTMNTTTLRSLLLAILKEMMYFSDIKDGTVMRKVDGRMQIDLSLCETGSDRVESAVRELSKGLICPDDMCYVSGCLVIPLRESMGNCVLIVLAPTKKLPIQKLQLFKLLADTSADVLKNFILMEERRIKERLADRMKIEELETLVRERTEELRQKDVQLIEMDRVASVHTLASGIAHEINNPLSFISSSIYSLKTSMAKMLDGIRFWEQHNFTPSMVQKYRDYLNQMNIGQMSEALNKKFDRLQHGTERILSIVNNLKKYSRVDMPFVEDVNINQTIEDSIKLLGTQEHPEIMFIKKYEDLPLIECCPQDINQSVYNVLKNAVDAIENSGQITICTLYDRTYDMIAINISDNGPGMSAETLKRAFNPFFTTKPIGKGTGLGLSIAEVVIKRHGGNITIKSESGQGTVVTITLPTHMKIEQK